jgi:lysozyme
MDIDQEGLDLIASFEGCVLHTYRDVVGVLTIGYGHALRAGDGFGPASTICHEEALKLLHDDAQRVVQEINTHVTVPLTQHQFNSLVSLGFNIGCGALDSSTLIKKLNAGDYAGADAQFAVWRMAGGKPNAVLEHRRQREALLFAE